MYFSDRLTALKTAVSMYRAELERRKRWRQIVAHEARLKLRVLLKQ